MPTITPQELERSDRVTGLATLADLRISHIRADLKNVSPAPPLTTNYEVIPTLLRLAADAVVYHIAYKVTAETRTKRLAFEAEVTISIVIDLSESVEEEDLQAFGTIGVLDIAHPYVRATVHSLALSMGLPPLVLEIKVPASMIKL
jgi:hypothetical protein